MSYLRSKAFAGFVVALALLCSSCARNKEMIREISGPDGKPVPEKESTSKYFQLPDPQPEFPLRRPPSMGAPE